MTSSLKPLTLGELLDRTFQLYRQHFLLFVGIMVLPHLLLLAVQLTGVLSGARGELSLLTVMWSFVTLVTALFVGTAGQAATIVAVSQLHLGRPMTISGAYAGFRHRIVTLVLVVIGVGLLVGLGTLLFIIPGILLALRWSLSVPVAVLEDLSVGAAMTRSAELTRGDRGRVFLIYCLYFILLLVGSSIWQIPTIGATFAAARDGAPPPIWALVVQQIGGFFTESLVGPLLTIAISLLYYDERVRKEAFDLEHMVNELGGSTASA
jgi:hypothetical protein